MPAIPKIPALINCLLCHKAKCLYNGVIYSRSHARASALSLNTLISVKSVWRNTLIMVLSYEHVNENESIRGPGQWS